jgi:hypothetical protein
MLTLPASKDVVRKHRPQWWECDMEGDWDKIIEQTRPERDPEAPFESISGYDSLFGFHEEWFARWYQRCMPISRICQTVLVRTRKIMTEKSGNKWPSPYHWSGL